MKFCLKLFKFTFLFVFYFILITFIIYFFNLDMKLIKKIQPLMNKYYDEMPRDRRI